jgi:spectinomycin phosphotransferase
VGVRSEPQDLDRAALVAALERHWRIDDARLDHLPVGFGSHHWGAVGADGSRWFVSADDLRGPRRAGRAPADVLTTLDRAFRTAAALRDDAGLEFVLAPVAGAAGDVVLGLDPGYAVRVEPFVEGTSSDDGEYEHPGERRLVGTLLGRLHAASASIPAGLPNREALALPGRAALEQALQELDGRWETGPFAEPTRDLLRAHARSVRDRLQDYDTIAARVHDDSGSWVVTHGEPHSANVIREPSDSLRLVDWDTALVAPRERDLWMVLDDELTGWDEYRAAAGPVELDRELLGLYRERWALAEICEYVSEFRQPHEETQDSRTAWTELREYLR